MSHPVVFQLGEGTDPGVDTDHVVSYRYRRSGEGIVNITAELREGYIDEDSLGTLIASWQHSDIGDEVTQANQELTTEQAGSITDYTDLFLRFVAS